MGQPIEATQSIPYINNSELLQNNKKQYDITHKNEPI